MRDNLLDLAESCLSFCQGDQAEVVIIKQNSSLTRFAGSIIHQNVSEKNVNLTLRVITGQKVGYASTNVLTSKAMKKVAESAYNSAKYLPKDPDFKSLPGPQRTYNNKRFSLITDKVTAKERAGLVLRIIKELKDESFQANGTVSNSTIDLSIVNSLGVKESVSSTSASITLVITGENGSGYAEQNEYDWEKINPVKVTRKALRKVESAERNIDIESGNYQVILEPLAVADMIATLAFCGLGALSFQESRSFLVNKIGQIVADKKITLWDDARDERTIGFPFDFEGQPKEKVVLIESGIGKNVVYDSYTANKEGKKSTGHALPAPNQYGPLPTNLILASGQKSIDELIRETENAILVTRFHYTNVEDPLNTVFTGMTRDGTFLIEKGRISGALPNLRFTQSILDCLKEVLEVGEGHQLCRSMLGLALVPALKLNSFCFTGISEE